MSEKSGDAVVSVRISKDAQDRLRQIAKARGTSVSDLVRSVVAREVSEPVQPVTRVSSGTAMSTGTTTTSASQPPVADQGFFWGIQNPIAISGATITLRS